MRNLFFVSYSSIDIKFLLDDYFLVFLYIYTLAYILHLLALQVEERLVAVVAAHVAVCHAYVVDGSGGVVAVKDETSCR